MSKLVNISEACSIAIHSLAIVANSDKLVNVNKIAEVTRFSRNHIAKIMNVLSKNNYVESIRGPKGGFKMNVPPENVTLFDIYQLIEGDIKVGHCMTNAVECPFGECIFGVMTTKFTKDLIDYLKGSTIKNFSISKLLIS